MPENQNIVNSFFSRLLGNTPCTSVHGISPCVCFFFTTPTVSYRRSRCLSPLRFFITIVSLIRSFPRACSFILSVFFVQRARQTIWNRFPLFICPFAARWVTFELSHSLHVYDKNMNSEINIKISSSSLWIRPYINRNGCSKRVDRIFTNQCCKNAVRTFWTYSTLCRLRFGNR